MYASLPFNHFAFANAMHKHRFPRENLSMMPSFVVLDVDDFLAVTVASFRKSRRHVNLKRSNCKVTALYTVMLSYYD